MSIRVWQIKISLMIIINFMLIIATFNVSTFAAMHRLLLVKKNKNKTNKIKTFFWVYKTRVAACHVTCVVFTLLLTASTRVSPKWKSKQRRIFPCFVWMNHKHGKKPAINILIYMKHWEKIFTTKIESLPWSRTCDTSSLYEYRQRRHNKTTPNAKWLEHRNVSWLLKH